MANAAVPQPDAADVARMLSIPHDQHELFTEAHPKLRPVESVTRGIFLAGCCQSPMDIPESVAAASAAAVKVCGILSHEELTLEARIAEVDADKCSGCLSCVQVCPFEAIQPEKMGSKTVSRITASICQGCGTCAATCPASAITINGFNNAQIYNQISAPFRKRGEEVAIGSSAE